MKLVFYITNHGFGHASRNVPIIRELLRRNPRCGIIIKSDQERCEFLKRNLKDIKHIRYYTNCNEYGLIMKKGSAYPDTSAMYDLVSSDIRHWDEYIKREEQFLAIEQPNVIIADIIGWAIRAANKCGIPSLLIGNFTWESMYQSYFGDEIWRPYRECYSMADKALWYDIHAEELHSCNPNYECISLISRDVNWNEVDRIRKKYDKPIVFVSIGASVELNKVICVEMLPYIFLTTRGIHLEGNNVEELPLDMINTPDYIAASEYVIAKGGWSTVAEILLQHKRCALLMRGNNSEDNRTREILELREQCVSFEEKELYDMAKLIRRIRELKPHPYTLYHDDRKMIVESIYKLAEGEYQNDTI